MTALHADRLEPADFPAPAPDAGTVSGTHRSVRPIKLLYLMPAEAFGGAERQGVEHICGLMRLGFDVTAVVGPGQPIREALHRKGVFRYVFMDDFPTTGPSRAAWAGTVGDWLQWVKAGPSCFKSILRIADSEPFDVVFGNRAISWPLAAMIGARLGVPYVIRSGGRPANPLTRPMLLALRTLFPPPALFVANCEAVRAPLAGWFDCPSAILHNGVDPDRYAPRDEAECRLETNVPAGPVVGMAARPAPEKGLDFLGKVAAATRRQVPNVSFVVAGEHVTRAHYEHRMDKLGLDHCVRFLGHLADMSPFYGSCDIVVLTSPRVSIEGSPNALLEAMAMARPIVATNVGGVPELVRHGVDGFLSDPEDVDGFATHVELLLNQPGLRAEMGASGRRRVIESFRADTMVNRLAGIIRLVAQPATDDAPADMPADASGW